MSQEGDGGHSKWVCEGVIRLLTDGHLRQFPIQSAIGGFARSRKSRDCAEVRLRRIAQAIPQIDAEIAEKGHLWMETSLKSVSLFCCSSKTIRPNNDDLVKSHQFYEAIDNEHRRSLSKCDKKNKKNQTAGAQEPCFFGSMQLERRELLFFSLWQSA